MILKIGDLIDFPNSPGQTVRIIWLSQQNDAVTLFRVNQVNALPELAPAQPLIEMLLKGEAVFMENDRYLPTVAEAALTPSRKRVRDRAWNLIKPLVENVPYIFSEERRGKLVQGVVDEARQGENPSVLRITKKSIYGYLRRFWQRGMVPNAVLADYPNSGAKGKSRKASKKKRGRPRKYGHATGINVTESIRKIFRVGFLRCYASDRQKKWSLSDAFHKILKDFFCEKIIDSETGKVTHQTSEKARQAGGLPTFEQFKYWSDKDHVRLEVKRKRLSARVYDKDFRGLIGTSNAEVMGPGDRYQIDATIADVYLVSRFDRNRIIGRPVIYVVIDVFSRMIVGLYVGLEGPSWVTAMMALANTAADKVEYCKKFGIDIEPEDWPCHFLPGVLLGDRGEIESAKINALINNFNVAVENAAAYRADWKGIIEQHFNLLPAMFKPYVPGYIEQDFRARGGKDYRLDAVLDIDEFTGIVIECTLYKNNHQEITRYDKDRDVKADGVPPIPVDLWGWGRTFRTGAMRSFPRDFVEFSLMPTDKAVVTTFGVKHKGSFYTCPQAIEERWFDQARQKGTWEVDISYDPRSLDTIYLHGTKSSNPFQVCTLTERSRAHCNASLWEVEQQDILDKHGAANRLESRQLARVDLNASIEKTVAGAVQKRGKPSTESDASRTKNIQGNRAEEKQANRETEVFRPSVKKPTAEAASAKIIDFPGSKPDSKVDYSLPSIEEILGEDDE